MELITKNTFTFSRKLKQEMKKAKHFKKLMKLEEKSREIPKQNQDETVVSIPDQPVKIRYVS